jgi:hypothetical protein
MEPIAPPPPGQDQRRTDDQGAQPTQQAGPEQWTEERQDGGTRDGRGAEGRLANVRSLFGPRRGITSVAEREAALSETVAVASFPSYSGAADAVARLAGGGFPIEQITIVGSDLKLVEEVTGRMNIPRAASMGAVSGAWFGALVAALVGIFAGSFGTFVALLLWGIVLGGVFGAGLGILGYISFDRSRGFTSDRLVVAAHYNLHTPRGIADRLRTELLARRSADVQIIDGTPAGV